MKKFVLNYISIIQFGFICMFAVSFPLSPLLSLFNNMVEIRIDAKKILNTMQRPVPRKEKGVRIWLPIIKGITRVAVITNGLIIAFTSEFVPRYANGSLDGYIDYAFSSKNLTDFGFVNATNEICRYKDFREPYNSPNKYNFTKDFYIILCARLIFVVIFEIFFGTCKIMSVKHVYI
ncbi:anoctamin-1 isoform X1 [Brachionus plicatilis]|uniref:Anoctamin n=1 Tax=Brachionus plicatilis TaxID=10195 RepID=A0A3M7PA32_BRAPC|nr:anoctamin-1 isoform X1 [Brachionus plicatilis]